MKSWRQVPQPRGVTSNSTHGSPELEITRTRVKKTIYVIFYILGLIQNAWYKFEPPTQMGQNKKLLSQGRSHTCSVSVCSHCGQWLLQSQPYRPLFTLSKSQCHYNVTLMGIESVHYFPLTLKRDKDNWPRLPHCKYLKLGDINPALRYCSLCFYRNKGLF